MTRSGAFTLITLRGSFGWTLFGLIWAMAAAGAIFKLLVPPGRWEAVSMVFYLGMGWAGVIGLRPLYDALSTGGFVWLLTGGVAYTLGVVFYFWQSIRHHHAIWHVFVMFGSACHFFAVHCSQSREPSSFLRARLYWI